MMSSSVLLDTSFFLRFLNENDPLFSNADAYFKHLIQTSYSLVISTISIAEYCVGGDVSELPLQNLQILPFNLNHAKRTGDLAKIAFDARKSGKIEVSNRNIIPNDTKLFAQGDIESKIKYYISSGSNSKKIYSLLRKSTPLTFEFIDLNTPYTASFGTLGL